ncbi:MAG: hypothetical protein DRP96_07110 [Candidatus Neomarinimicrobiota bacterium]|nr:MAG: hypothetical protein DRP96_07110 [Candidatus Neomarinimicrobiota bacterium]
MKVRKLALVWLTILATAPGISYSLPTESIVKEFKNMDSIVLDLVSGDCIIKAESTKRIRVEVEYSETLKDVVKPEFMERGKKLKLKERWHSRGSGTLLWKITVPKDIDVKFSSASGDFEIDGCSGDIEISTASGNAAASGCSGKFDIETASGDIGLEDCSGVFDISAASGDISMENSKGSVEVSTASGDIYINDFKGTLDLSAASGDMEIENVNYEDDSDFSAASGDIDIRFDKMPKVRLDVCVASGDIELDLNKNKPTGLIQCIARKDRGRITSDIPFDITEEFVRNNRTYLKKTIKTGAAKPEIYLETASGKISIDK